MIRVEESSVTVELLRGIRDTVEGTNRRVDQLREENNEKFAETNRRLDFLAEGHTRLFTEVAELRGVTERNGKAIERNGKAIERNGKAIERVERRLNNVIDLSGEAVRSLNGRTLRVENHLGLDE